MKLRVVILGFLVGWLLGGAWIAHARADGGTLRAWERHGRYEIAVFTSPTPIAAGPVDVSVLLLDSRTGEPIDKARVTVTATQRSRSGVKLHGSATRNAATNKLMYAALFDLPEPGTWDVHVDIDRDGESSGIVFTVDAKHARPEWVALIPWVCWPFPVIALYAIHQWLVRRASLPMARRPIPSG